MFGARVTSVMDTLLVGYRVARDKIDRRPAELEGEAAKVGAAVAAAVDGLWPLLTREQQDELSGQRDAVIATLVKRILDGDVVTSSDHAS